MQMPKKKVLRTVKAVKKTVKPKTQQPLSTKKTAVVVPITYPQEVKKPVIYLNNRELLAAVKHAKTLGKMSDHLAQMLQLLCAKYAKKGNFANYTYNDDMQAYAMLMLVRTWNSFDPKKSQNPFAFFTQCIKNSFIQYLNQEKRHRNIRDELLLDQGLNASFGFGDGEDGDGEGRHQEQMSARPHLVEDEEDLESFEHEMEKLERNVGEKDFVKVGEVAVIEEEVVITHPEDHEDEETKDDEELLDDEDDNLKEEK
jgi:DNA-directed RNA polymerase specialized sigma24 family protein